MDILREGVIGIFQRICSTIDIMVQCAPGITVNDETHGQLEQLSVCLFFYVTGNYSIMFQGHKKALRAGFFPVPRQQFYKNILHR